MEERAHGLDSIRRAELQCCPSKYVVLLLEACIGRFKPAKHLHDWQHEHFRSAHLSLSGRPPFGFGAGRTTSR